jgi:hypothetical protein
LTVGSEKPSRIFCASIPNRKARLAGLLQETGINLGADKAGDGI